MAQENLGRDLKLKLIDNRALSIYAVEDKTRRQRAGGKMARVNDFIAIEGRDNLGQALIARILTPKGELTPLGHPDYGSRLEEVIGQPNTPTTRNLAKLFILEALKAERRVDKITDVTVTPHQTNRFLIEIAVAVIPVGAEEELALSFAVEL
ncbi:MAG: hypothetical protein AAGJ28_02465 [Pseudomonadota bacterium]